MAHPLTEYRKRHGLTLEQFAERIQSTRGQVCKWEKGAIPRPKAMTKIREATDGEITANDFMPEEERAA